jgi:phage terminase small subunit
MAEQTKIADKLTEKQEAFCIEYVLNKGNATEAARRAGYSDSDEDVLASIGFQNLRKVQIIARIAELREQSCTKTGANVEWLTSLLVSTIENAYTDRDHKSVAMNSTVLMKLMGWDDRTISAIPIEKLANIAVAQWKAMKESTRPRS